MAREEEEKEGEQLVELKFRLFDGTDLGPRKYATETTIATIKENILSQWPQGTAYSSPFPLILLVSFPRPFLSSVSDIWILQFTKNDCFLSIFCSVFFPLLVFVFVNVFYSSWQASRRGHGFPSALALMLRPIFLVHCCCCFWHGRRRKTCECGVEHCRCSINLSLILLLW